MLFKQLVEPDSALTPGKIRDSNRTALLALLQEQRFQPVDLGIAKDTYVLNSYNISYVYFVCLQK